MKILKNGNGTLTFVPVSAEETQVITAILSTIAPGAKLAYGGRETESDDATFSTIYLHAGAQEVEDVEIDGNLTVHRTDHVGGVTLALSGSTKDDKYAVNSIRNACFFGSAGLIFLGESTVDDKRSLLVTMMLCSLCEGNMITHLECQSGVCNACAEKCAHTYERTLFHSEDIDIGVVNACTKCFRTEPQAEGENPPTLEEHHRAAQEEFGAMLIDSAEELACVLFTAMAAKFGNGGVPQEKKTIADRCCGAQRIDSVADGHGTTLKFIDVPDSMSGAFLEELCGLDGTYKHPLEGAVYYTENTGPDTFSVTIFQNDLKEDLPEAFAGWFMGHCYMEYADNATMAKVLSAKHAV